MFLVGGFSESPLLQEEMRKEFGHLLNIIIPQECSLTVLKGNNNFSNFFFNENLLKRSISKHLVFWL
jgi:hypothetical protein